MHKHVGSFASKFFRASCASLFRQQTSTSTVNMIIGSYSRKLAPCKPDGCVHRENMAPIVHVLFISWTPPITHKHVEEECVCVSEPSEIQADSGLQWPRSAPIQFHRCSSRKVLIWHQVTRGMKQRLSVSVGWNNPSSHPQTCVKALNHLLT